MPKFSHGSTIGELYRPAMKITDQQEADQYFEDLVAFSMSFGNSRAEAENIQRQNLGYFTGYYDSETAARVFRLFRCSHPIFGTSRPTAEEALAAGKKMAEEKMPSCERCWRMSGGDPERYRELLQSQTCTPEEQAGPDAGVCPVCGCRTIHQHIPGFCTVCGDLSLRHDDAQP